MSELQGKLVDKEEQQKTESGALVVFGEGVTPVVSPLLSRWPWTPMRSYLLQHGVEDSSDTGRSGR